MSNHVGNFVLDEYLSLSIILSWKYSCFNELYTLNKESLRNPRKKLRTEIVFKSLVESKVGFSAYGCVFRLFNSTVAIP